MKVLIVEDNEDNRRLARKRLRASGHTVLEAVSGEEALACLPVEKPDLVLLDIQLPDISGLEVVEKIRQEPEIADTVVVACTAFAMIGDRSKALEAGCDGYIAKPVDIRALPGQLEEIWHATRK